MLGDARAASRSRRRAVARPRHLRHDDRVRERRPVPAARPAAARAAAGRGRPRWASGRGRSTSFPRVDGAQRRPRRRGVGVQPARRRRDRSRVRGAGARVRARRSRCPSRSAASTAPASASPTTSRSCSASTSRSIFERKNPLAVVDAFRRAFAPGDGPRLLIKSVNARRVAARVGAAARPRPRTAPTSRSATDTSRDGRPAGADGRVRLLRVAAPRRGLRPHDGRGDGGRRGR